MFSRDFYDSEVYKIYPELLDVLLKDRSSNKNIIWATDNYKSKGFPYNANMYILKELITGRASRVIKPRIEKSKTEQAKRSKSNAEVFTPSWVCNKQNNLVDEAWFGYKNSFNIENNDNTWTICEKVEFKDRDWKDYVFDVRLEITCGEAPYLVSRYDTVTGEEIELEKRIGLLDRKLRVVNENAATDAEWIDYSIKALQSIYGFEFQGDNLLLARENVLLDYVDYYINRFNTIPSKELLDKIVEIISWNIWQMDGIKMVVPYSCHKEDIVQLSLFDEVEPKFCKGCRNGCVKDHNGIRCVIKDWKKNKKIKFLDLV